MFAEEEMITEDQPHVEGESELLWELRVMAVSVFWALPGVLFGALARLGIPKGGPVSWWLIGCGILGAIVGGLVEAEHIPA